MAKQWLEDRWVELGSKLNKARTKKAIKQICVEEIAEWKERGTITSPSSWKEPMTDTRNFIRSLHLPARREMWALEIMNWSKDEWASMNAASLSTKEEKIEREIMIATPDVIIYEIERCLRERQSWKIIAVGLALATGRRLREILQTADFTVKSSHSVIFSGQLKQKFERPPYEIATLAPAALVVDALHRLRAMTPHFVNMRDDLFSQSYSTPLGVVATSRFGKLVEGTLSMKDLRDLYAGLSVYALCPEGVSSIAFQAECLGHRVFDGEKDQRDYEATLHYRSFVTREKGAFLKRGVRTLEKFR